MVFDVFHSRKKRKKQPELLRESEEPERKVKDMETLKAGKLARLALELTGTLIKTHGPRPSGGKSALSVAEDLKQAYQSFCDEARCDDEHFHTQAIHIPLKLMPILYPVLLALLWCGLPLTATIIAVLFFAISYSQSFLYKPILERWTKSVDGKNVWATIRPEGEARHTVIFSGHHDSARISTYSKEEKWEYAKNVLLPVVLFLLLVVESAVQLLTEIFTGKLLGVGLPPVSLAIFLTLLTAGFPLVLHLRSFYTGESSPGAGDNLVSSAVTVELARYFDWKKRCGEPLSSTRLIFASFDGEEDGLLGSKAWFSRHKDFLSGDVVMLNFDCVFYADRLMFLEKDINGQQPLSCKLARRMVAIAKGMGYSAQSGSIPLFAGGTDAAEGARAGIEACSLVAVGWGDRMHPEVYHTSDDTVDHIEEKAVEEALSLGIKLAELVDKEKLYDEGTPDTENPCKDDVQRPVLHFRKLV